MGLIKISTNNLQVKRKWLEQEEGHQTLFDHGKMEQKNKIGHQK